MYDALTLQPLVTMIADTAVDPGQPAVRREDHVGLKTGVP